MYVHVLKILLRTNHRIEDSTSQSWHSAFFVCSIMFLFQRRIFRGRGERESRGYFYVYFLICILIHTKNRYDSIILLTKCPPLFKNIPPKYPSLSCAYYYVEHPSTCVRLSLAAILRYSRVGLKNPTLRMSISETQVRKIQSLISTQPIWKISRLS